MTGRVSLMPDISTSFPAPFAGAERQSWRAIAESLGRNALAGFPARAFEEMAVARSFVGRQQIILSDPAGIRHILIENADNYRRTASVFRLLGPILGKGLFLAEGEDWRARRRAAAPAFAPRMMGAVAGHVARAADRLAGDLAAQGGAEVDLFARMQLLALEIAARALFSLDIADEAPALRSELRRYADGLGRPTLVDFMMPRGLPVPRSWARWRFRRRWMARIARVHILIENADNYRRTASVFRLLGPILGPWRTGADFRRGRAARSWPGGCGRRIAAPRLHPSGGRRGAAPLPARLLDRTPGARAR